MESFLWYTKGWDLTGMIVPPILAVVFICFLYYQFNNKQNVSKEATHEVSNNATQTLEEDFWLSSSTEENADNCDICDIKWEASKYCSQCEQYLCIKCLNVHKKITLTKDHEVTDCENVTEKKLKSRHLALWSTWQTYNHGYNEEKKLVGFNTTESTTEIRFLAEEINSNTKLYLGTSSLNVNECASRKEIKVENLTRTHYKEVKKHLYFVAGNEVKYFTFRPYKKVCKMAEDMETATIVFTTPGHCYGITKFDNGLALVHEQDGSFRTPKWQIHVYSLEGVLKQQILHDKDRQPLFEKPEYLSTNTEENILYATDTMKNVLYAFDIKGTIVFKFKSKAMLSPRGLTTDYEGNIYIACRGRVLQLQENGVKYRTILHMGKGNETKCLEDVYFDKESAQLAVIEDYLTGSVFRFLKD